MINLTILIVLYEIRYNASSSYKSVVDNLDIIKNNFKNFNIIIYDNSRYEQKIDHDEINELKIKYLLDSKNGGVAMAYNYAYNYAKQENSSWLLLLDQDTELNKNYFTELSKITNNLLSNKNIAAIVPRIFFKGTNFSPCKVKWGGIHRSIDSKYTGPYSKGEIMAVGSASVLRISFIDEIKGFNPLFWLDCQDRWIYKKIFDTKKIVYIMKNKIEHELSVLDFKKLMNPNRYFNQIYYESLFMMMYKTIAENVFYLIRLFRRAVYLFFRTKNIKYSIISVVMITKIIKSKFNSENFKTSINPKKYNV